MTSPKNVLIIDDDKEIAGSLQAVLEGVGHRVTHAINGIEGQRQIESLRPDLVITDMMMPKMGGFPVLEFLKNLSSPPKVIMITANEGGRHKAYAEMLGVVEYLRKPFPMEQLFEAIRKAFPEAEADAEAAPVKRRKKSADDEE